MRRTIRISVGPVIAALALLGASGFVHAQSTFSADADFNLMLTSFSNVAPSASLGTNLLITSSDVVDYDIQSTTGDATLLSVPSINGPIGYWHLLDSYSHHSSSSGTAGDVVGTANADLSSTGTITLLNITDVETTFVFHWTLSLAASAGTGFVTPDEDFASSFADFSFSSSGMTCTSAPSAMSASASTSNPALPGSASASGDLSCLLQPGGVIGTLNITEHTGGEASASFTGVPLPGAVWLMLSGFGAIGIFARRRRV